MYDYHTHTDFSDDSSTPINEMLEGAIARGLREIAITDHYDPDYPDPNFPFEVDFEAYHRALLDAQDLYGSRIRLVKGLEIGIQHGSTLSKCAQAAGAFPYDFLIGSFHCFDGVDLYTAPYHEMPRNAILPAYYRYVRRCLSEYMEFDVLGHLNVIDRYLSYEPDYKAVESEIDDILRLLSQNGKGLEINTSSYRYGMGGRTHPSLEILRRYRTLGGDVLTIGSDAHRPEDLAGNFREAVEMAEAAGFRYFTVFKDRKPRMVPLSELLR
jgi:histidinol-phosphatase (PHP family)